MRKRGIFISPSGVRCVLLRHNLETFKKRLLGLETKVKEEGIILTESQVAALERKKEEKGELWRDRDDASRVSRLPGYVLCGQYERSGKDLPANPL